MSSESGRDSNPPKEAELSPELKALQNIREHVNHAELESPRFQAFADYVDREFASLSEKSEKQGHVTDVPDRTLVEETIRQRRNGVKGYKKEFIAATKLGNDYSKELRRKFDMPLMANFTFCNELMKIKESVVDRYNF